MRVAHGLTTSPEWRKTYQAWKNMNFRCHGGRRLNCHYGGRGISVCERWRGNFLNFIADMGKAPKGMTLERKDVDGNYDPVNCCWATWKAQGRNRRNNMFVSLFGERITAIEACERLNLSTQGMRIWKWRHKRTEQEYIEKFAGIET